MAESRIEGYEITNGTITRTGTTSGVMDTVRCQKIRNIVTVSGRIHSISDSSATANKAYFIIPLGFRPREDIHCSGYIMINGSPIPTMFEITADGGNVMVGYGSAVLTQIFFCATYSI